MQCLLRIHRRRVSGQRGQTTPEYVTMLGMITLVIVGAVIAIANAENVVYERVASAIG